MGIAVVTLKKGEGRLLKSGGMWIFDNEIDSIMGSFENGDIVLVHDFDGYPMGRGFINTNSKITVRLMTRDENVEINEELLEKRVRLPAGLYLERQIFFRDLLWISFLMCLLSSHWRLESTVSKRRSWSLLRKFLRKMELRSVVFMREVM